MAAIENSKSPPAVHLRAPIARPASRGVRSSDLFWNVMTMLVWLGMASMVMIFLSIYANPSSRLNPFSPVQPTLVSVIRLPTETPSPTPDPAAVVADTPELAPTATQVTPTVTRTSLPTATETATAGPSPTPTVYSVYPFKLHNDIYVIAGDAMPLHDTCKLWVAGQTYDLQNVPIVGIQIMLGGYLDGKTISVLSLTGTAPQFGQAGYEFILAEHPVESKGSLWVMLLDQAGIPLSGKVYFDTYDNCEQNLILINFKQVR